VNPSYKGQRSVPATDQKFRPTDEHLLEKNKEELNEVKHGDKKESSSTHHHDNPAEGDKDTTKA
jgi:hypothetical protein